MLNYIFAYSVQLTYSVLSDSVNPWIAAWGFLVHQQLRELAQTHVHRVSDAIQPSYPLSSPSPASIFPSNGVFSNESAHHIRWPKDWSFSFNIRPSNEHPGLISFRMDWLDPLQSKGLSRVFSNISWKASILWHSAFFLVQLSHPYMTTGKTIALTRQTFFGKVMSLLLNMLFRLVITFLPRSKCLLISWLQSPSAVILEPKTELLAVQKWRAAERSYPTSKVRSSSCEDIPHLQGKEQQLHFAGAAVKRYRTSKVRETQVRR